MFAPLPIQTQSPPPCPPPCPRPTPLPTSRPPSGSRRRRRKRRPGTSPRKAGEPPGIFGERATIWTPKFSGREVGNNSGKGAPKQVFWLAAKWTKKRSRQFLEAPPWVWISRVWMACWALGLARRFPQNPRGVGPRAPREAGSTRIAVAQKREGGPCWPAFELAVCPVVFVYFPH